MRVCDLLAPFTIVTVVRTSSLKLLNYNDPVPNGGSIIPIQPFSNREPHYVHIENEQINEILVSTDQLPSRIREKEQQSWLVVSVCAYSLLNETYYSVNYVRKSAIRQRIFVDLNAQQLQLVTAQMTELRFDVINICVARIHGHEQKFAAVWHRTDSFLFHFIIQIDMLNSCMKTDAKNARENYYATVFEVFKSDNEEYCVAIWKKHNGIRYRMQIGNDLSSMQKQMKNSQMNITAVSAISKNRQTIFYVIWRSSNFSWQNRQIPITTLKSIGNKPNRLLDEEIQRVMQIEQIPSLSIAVITDEGLQISKAYGFADIRQRKNVTPFSKYRIASISKVITAMAIEKLIEMKLLKSIDERVFGDRSILGTKYGQFVYNQFLTNVTVKHLLEHTIGSWGNREKLEYERKELNRSEFLSWLLDKHPMRRPPGKVHLYSNIGYIFLGRVIEVVTTQTYEEFVRQQILKPLNITASIGHKQRNQRQDLEVSYYSSDNANPYFNWDPERMDSAAGWVLSATEIAKIMLHLSTRKSNGESSMLWQRSERRPDYGRGLQLHSAQNILYHLGSIAGTESIAFSAPNFALGMLINTRSARENYLTAWMQRVANFLRSDFLR